MSLLHGNEQILLRFNETFKEYQKNVGDLHGSDPSFENNLFVYQRKCLLKIIGNFRDFLLHLRIALCEYGMEVGNEIDQFIVCILHVLREKCSDVKSELDDISESSYGFVRDEKKSESSYYSDDAREDMDRFQEVSRASSEKSESGKLEKTVNISNSVHEFKEFNKWMNVIEILHHNILIRLAASAELNDGFMENKTEDLKLLVGSMQQYYHSARGFFYRHVR